ncbi:unnamed protein product [Rotaria sordida]|uniref:Uncharacterized protein n=1 Tax=Rotaria sordida TaxID=392033 RepID=A0A818IW43_9BILA|nr:unnamed protein product [Rotaria sordida]
MNDYDNDDQTSGCSNGSFDRITVDNREMIDHRRIRKTTTLVTVSLEQEWPTPLPDYIDNDEVLYIRDILFNIFMEEYDQSMKKSKIIRNNSEDKDNTDDNTTSTSTSSSFPTPRFLQESFGHIDLSLNR